jgi:hypothetical protein
MRSKQNSSGGKVLRMEDDMEPTRPEGATLESVTGTSLYDLPAFWQDHYLEAERLLAIGNDNNVRKAQVHATLATVLVGHEGGPVAYRSGPMLTAHQANEARKRSQ